MEEQNLPNIEYVASPMTQAFLQKEKKIIFPTEPLGEFLDCMVKSMLLFLRCGMTELRYFNFVNLHKGYYDYELADGDDRKEADLTISVARFANGKDPSY